MGYFARHQERERFPNPRVVGAIDQPFMNHLHARLCGEVGYQAKGGVADGADARRRARHAASKGRLRAAAVWQLRVIRIVASTTNGAIHPRFAHVTFGAALGALAQHGDDDAYHFQIAQLLRSEVDAHVLAAKLILGMTLGEVAARGGQLALWAAELFKHEILETRTGLADSNVVEQPFVVRKHSQLLSRETAARADAGLKQTFCWNRSNRATRVPHKKISAESIARVLVRSFCLLTSFVGSRLLKLFGRFFQRLLQPCAAARPIGLKRCGTPRARLQTLGFWIAHRAPPVG